MRSSEPATMLTNADYQNWEDNWSSAKLTLRAKSVRKIITVFLFRLKKNSLISQGDVLHVTISPRTALVVPTQYTAPNVEVANTRSLWLAPFQAQHLRGILLQSDTHV
jgi:hypothetical protein